MSSQKSECAGKNPFPWARPNKIICCLMMNKLSAFCVVPVLFSAVFHAGCTSGMSDEQARQVVRCSYETILDDGSPRSEVAVSPPWEDRRNPESVALSRTKLKAMRQLMRNEEAATLRDFYGETALHKAAAAGDVPAMKELLEAGLDVNDRSSADGATPLHQACRLEQVEAVAVLLARGADPNVGDSAGETPLFDHYCASREIMSMLLKAGANPNRPNKEGFYAVVLSDFPDLLVRHGANPNLLVTSTNNTVFMQRMLNFGDDRDPGVQAMLQGGADVNLATDDGYTPLMMAAENRLSGLVRELIARGADVKARDRFGKSASDYTRRHSLHYRVLSDGGNLLAGTVQEDSEELREVRRVLREHGGR